MSMNVLLIMAVVNNDAEIDLEITYVAVTLVTQRLLLIQENVMVYCSSLFLSAYVDFMCLDGAQKVA